LRKSNKTRRNTVQPVTLQRETLQVGRNFYEHRFSGLEPSQLQPLEGGEVGGFGELELVAGKSHEGKRKGTRGGRLREARYEEEIQGMAEEIYPPNTRCSRAGKLFSRIE
jgi:hypothetical protein